MNNLSRGTIPSMIKRVFADIFLIFLAFIAPWWVTFLIMLVFTSIFLNYYEALLVGIIIDSLYGSSFVAWHFPLMITFIFMLIILGIDRFKKQLIV